MTNRERGAVSAFMGCASYATLAMVGVLGLGAGQAFAQGKPQVAATIAAESNTDVEEVVVTGFRASVATSLEVKRKADVMVDAITAEDIADFPDSNLAESLQRLPGVSIDRFDGEGRSITVRGLGGDFTRTRLNGLEALSTAGANESGGTVGINRSRSFDYNTFASELFSQLKVQKTASAEVDEGSLGATVDLTTGRPFNFKGQRIALSAEDAYYVAGKKNNPRFTALYSNRWADGKVGFLASAAYSERDQTIDSYSRQAAQFDYAYRGSTFATTPAPTAGIPVVIQRQGFAAPTGTSCTGAPAGPTATGVVPGLNITYQPACDYQRGSNPAAYALVNSVVGAQRTRDPVTGVITTTSAGSLVRVPGLPTLNQQQIGQTRLGLTSTLEFRPDDRHHISIDGVYSRMAYDSQQFQIQTIGMNRNNTVAGFDTVSGATLDATKQGF